MRRLRLEMRDLRGGSRWRWMLSDEVTRQPLADHAVDLTDAGDEFAGFTDLYRFVRRNVVPDRRVTSEAAILAQVGAWAGRAVLGEPVGTAIVAAAPASVRVVVPAGAGFVLGWPLELAHIAGQPLAARGDVSLIHELPGRDAGPSGVAADPAGGENPSELALRILAVFSLPSEASVLALRRERYELTRLIRRIAVQQGRKVDLTVVQYGATRQRLAEIAQAAEGWDVLHLSGHGSRDLFVLEHPDGTPDPVDTVALTGLLAPLRRRVRLAVVSACETAAVTAGETMRWLGLDDQAHALEQQAAGEAARTGQAAAGMAQAIAADLGCPVVAMRYPVADEFAVGFAEEFYERLLGVRDTLPGTIAQPLGGVVAQAVKAAAGAAPSTARPPLSLGTPVLISGGGDAGGWCLRQLSAGRCRTLVRYSSNGSLPSPSGSSAGPPRWRALAPPWHPAAAWPACCFMGWQDQARPPAQQNWPAGTETHSPPPPTGRPLRPMTNSARHSRAWQRRLTCSLAGLGARCRARSSRKPQRKHSRQAWPGC